MVNARLADQRGEGMFPNVLKMFKSNVKHVKSSTNLCSVVM